jgi:hypothetical protein
MKRAQSHLPIVLTQAPAGSAGFNAISGAGLCDARPA